MSKGIMYAFFVKNEEVANILNMFLIILQKKKILWVGESTQIKNYAHNEDLSHKRAKK